MDLLWGGRVLVNVSYMAAQCTANQEPFAKFGIVPIADLAPVEVSARKQTFA